jgi:replicative DNA helicase
VNTDEITLPVCQVEEHSILGAILENSAEAYGVATQHGLVSEDFFLQSHRMIYSALTELGEAGEAVDIITVAGKLRDRGQLPQIGGEAYLASLVDGVVYDRKSLASYAKRVRNSADLRRLISACQATIAHSADNGARAQECLDLLSEHVLAIQIGSTDTPTERIGKGADYASWDSISERGQSLLGLTTAISSLDATTTGIRSEEFWIIGGRTGDGKTSLALQIAAANCKEGIPVLMFSLEMSREELAQRLWAQETAVPFWKIRNPVRISPEEKIRVRLATDEMCSWPLWINDAGSLSIQKLCSLARIAIRQHKVRLICVDYLQLVSCAARDERERLTKVSNALRVLAKTTGVPVLAVSQLSRPRDGDANRRPNRFSLKESGSLENDAHLILLTYRPTNQFDQPTGEDELIIAKQRHGPVGSEPMYFKPETLKFYERTRVQSSGVLTQAPYSGEME